LVLSRVVSKHRTVILLSVILIGSLISITADVKSSFILTKLGSLISCGFYPIQKAVQTVQNAAGGAFGSLLAVGRVRSENERLEETVDLLQGKVVRTRELQKENERLRKLLGFAEKRELRFMPVELIGKDATSWFSMVTIGTGGRDGIKKDLGVVTDSGVVGRVLNVQPLSAGVLLLTDSNSRIGAVVQRTRAQGVIQGNDRGGCILKFLDPMANVERGDLVVTSGDSLIFPKGLAIGEVTRVEHGRGELLKWVEVRPSAKLSQLEEAVVILP
jgi:rod shape-determining protein MreC